MKLIVQNISTEYIDEGSGEVVLCLHGWQSNLHSFDSLASSLVRTQRVIRLDLPGFGTSEEPDEPWGVDEYVKFVDKFIQKLEIKPAVIIGHSFGGRIAIKGLASGTFTPRCCVLIASAGVAVRKTFFSTAMKAAVKVIGLVTYIPPLIFWRESLRKKLYHAIGSDYYAAGRMKETFKRVVNDDLTAHAQRIATPTLLIWGEDDHVTPPSEGIRLLRLIPNAKLETVEGAGHFVHQEKPKRTRRLIQAFI